MESLLSLNKLGAAFVVVLSMLVVAPKTASAATITLDVVLGNLYQQTVQNPCIFTNPSCQQPDGFTSTPVPNGGGVEDWDIEVTYDGSDLLALLDGGSLLLGLDINQADDPQTLLGFEMYINDVQPGTCLRATTVTATLITCSRGSRRSTGMTKLRSVSFLMMRTTAQRMSS